MRLKRMEHTTAVAEGPEQRAGMDQVGQGKGRRRSRLLPATAAVLAVATGMVGVGLTSGPDRPTRGVTSLEHNQLSTSRAADPAPQVSADAGRPSLAILAGVAEGGNPATGAAHPSRRRRSG